MFLLQLDYPKIFLEVTKTSTGNLEILNRFYFSAVVYILCQVIGRKC